MGDILWDNLEMFPHIKQEIAKIQIPIYPAIGNHDHDMAVQNIAGDDDSAAELEKTIISFWTISFIKETRSMKWGSMISSSIG